MLYLIIFGLIAISVIWATAIYEIIKLRGNLRLFALYGNTSGIAACKLCKACPSYNPLGKAGVKCQPK